MKVIIFGAENRGCMIATALFENHDVSIIDKPEKITEDFYKLDIEIIRGSATDTEVLKNAGIASADVFIGCSGDDEKNILACLFAKTMTEAKTICFLYDETYINAIKNIKEKGDFLTSTPDFVISPKELLTKELFRIITVPDATDVENFAGDKVRMLEYPIKEGSKLSNQKLKDIKFPENILIAGITKENKLLVPGGETILQPNDKVVFIGTKESLETLAEEFFEEKNKVKTVIISGGGTVGALLAENLNKYGVRTKIIEKNHERCEEISQILPKTLIINGDGTDPGILREEDTESADVFVSVTDSDEKNLLSSLIAKQLGVKKVVSRVMKENNIKLFEKVGIDVAVSENDASLHEINNRFIRTDVSILATVERGQGEIIEIFLPTTFESRKISDLQMPYKAIIAVIERKGGVIIPNGNTVIYPCDNLIIFTQKETSSAIKKYLFGR